ncbi:MAG: fructose-6-phosphate aldolase [Sandaracinaceae bacterium]|nr:fructose-6-phosphate aldolase [Sandaracinaceae bacterium]MDW8246079.1 fructose-6-phosphate aldolase [Sandaracinaceae bacterium]
MKLFLDSADLSEIREAASMGLIDGVTTNPTLVAKVGRPLREIVREIAEVVDGPISAEVISTDYEGMIREGRELAAIHPNVVVKIPLTADGLRAVKRFAQDGIRTNVTLCFSPSQALLAAKAGATYISPFIGRIDDVSAEGMNLLRQIVRIFKNYQFNTQVLAASIRHPLHVVEAAEIGADVATLPYKVLTQLLRHPLTEVGLAAFLADAQRIPTSQK